MTESPPELDYPRLVQISYQCLTAHHVTELEMVLAGKVIELSFAIGRPFAAFDYAVELARISGISKGRAHGVMARLRSACILQVDDREVIYTFLPASKAWPWTLERRVKGDDRPEVQRLEAALVRMNQHWPAQLEFFAPEVEREFAEALAVERMREALLDAHRTAAAQLGQINFPVMDRLPKPAPTPLALSRGEGHSRPLGTGSSGGAAAFDPETFAKLPSDASSFVSGGAESAAGSLLVNREVPEKGTQLLRALRVSEQSIASKSLKLSEGEFPKREPLDVGASEDQMMVWLRARLGTQTMDAWGGWWRLRIRESRYAVLNACMELHLRQIDSRAKPLRNAGGWLRDKFYKIFGEGVAEGAKN